LRNGKAWQNYRSGSGGVRIHKSGFLRGEMGRAMFQKDLEAEAFTGIEGFNL